jgi:hypothetical protein
MQSRRPPAKQRPLKKATRPDKPKAKQNNKNTNNFENRKLKTKN